MFQIQTQFHINSRSPRVPPTPHPPTNPDHQDAPVPPPPPSTPTTHQSWSPRNPPIHTQPILEYHRLPPFFFFIYFKIALQSSMLHHAPDYSLTYVPRAVYSRSRPRHVDCGPQPCSNRCQQREPLAPPGCSGHLQTAAGCPETPWRACHSSARLPATQFTLSMWFVSRRGIENAAETAWCGMS